MIEAPETATPDCVESATIPMLPVEPDAGPKRRGRSKNKPKAKKKTAKKTAKKAAKKGKK